MDKFRKNIVSEDYLDGYSDCLNDIEKALPQSMAATSMEMLNCFIVALHLGKQSIKELREALNEGIHFEKEYCDLCSALFYLKVKNITKG